jgi:hypothetical protein
VPPAQPATTEPDPQPSNTAQDAEDDAFGAFETWFSKDRDNF